MNSQEYRNLSEAYLDVYQEIDEATAMAKRGLNEPAIRQQIASKTGGGSFADKAGKLADRETYGNKGMKAGRENLARKQRGDFRDTTSSSPGLHGYGHKATTDADKAKQSARGAQRSALTPNEKKQLNREELSLDERVLGQDPEMRRARTKDEKRLPPSSGKEYAANQKKSISYMDKLTKNNKIIPGMAHESYDLFDYIMEYLITEGYADTNESALVIMANMSEDWRESIVEGYQEPRFGRKDYLKKLSKRGGMGMGTQEDPHGYRDPKMANVGAEFSKRKTAAMKAKKSGEPDTYRAEKESQSKNR